MSSALESRGYDAEWLKQTYLLGVDLTLDDGSAYPARIFETALRQSERAVADELGLTLQPQTYTERHDKEPSAPAEWWPIRTQQRPLLSVERLSVVYGRSSTRAELPPAWAQITEPLAGQLHLIPTTEGSASYFVQSGLPVILGLGGLSSDIYVPAYFELKYKAGFASERGAATFNAGDTRAEITFTSPLTGRYEVSLDNAGAYVAERTPEGLIIELDTPAATPLSVGFVADTLPSTLIRAVGLKAANVVLNIAGDLISGAGIAQLSTSVDGLSSNIATTSSATNAGYGARILQYERELKELMKTLKANYQALNFMAL
jgi:hypothetical protein